MLYVVWMDGWVYVTPLCTGEAEEMAARKQAEIEREAERKRREEMREAKKRAIKHERAERARQKRMLKEVRGYICY